MGIRVTNSKSQMVFHYHVSINKAIRVKISTDEADLSMLALTGSHNT